MNREEIISIRPCQDTDLGFIYSTWLLGLKFGNELFNLIDEDRYFETYRKVLGAIIEKPTTTIQVACLKEDADVIIGYCISEDEKLHWIYTKEAWRDIGVARSLIPKFKVVTHLTKMGQIILKKNHPEVIFDPFII